MSIILTIDIGFEGFVLCRVVFSYLNIQIKEKSLSFCCILQLVRVAGP